MKKNGIVNWDNLRVVLTGASSGIGRALALVLAERGARLALVARRAEALAELGSAIEESGGRRPLVVVCDVGDLAQVGALHAEVEAQWGGADVLINNAGRGHYGPFADADVRECAAVVQTNLLGVIYCTRAFLPGMLAQGRGRLVFISSIVGEFPVPKHAVYSATKFAMSGLAESLDYELAPQGIGVHLVEPGLVRTEFAARAGTQHLPVQEKFAKSAEEVAQAIADAVAAGKRKSVPDAAAHLLIKLRQHLPRLTRFAFRRVCRRL